MPNSKKINATRITVPILSSKGLRAMWAVSRNPYKRFEFRIRPWAGDQAPGTRIDILIDAMADLFHVERTLFRQTGTRDADMVYAQQLSWWILRDRWKLPYELLAGYFDHDRSSISYGVSRVQDLMETDPDFATFVELIPFYANVEIVGQTETALEGLLHPQGMLPMPVEIKTQPRARETAKKGNRRAST
jgi:hypothetical protein